MGFSKALVLFFKVPEKGQVKTRLAKTLGNSLTLKIYKHLLKKTIRIMENLEGIDLFGFYCGKLNWEVLSYFNHKKAWKIIPQIGIDFSEKLKGVVEQLFALGYEKIVLIGADCPYITTTYISSAFENLKKYPVVIGPSKDGGYVLLEISKNFYNYSILFDGLPFETPDLLKETLLKLREGLFYLLPFHEDIDTFGDLVRYFLRSVAQIKHLR
ncbi:MAG: TIGR04282 family arsenosugar biosynthesis glycosyltransferase [Caldimicrobium sp.]